MQKRIGTVKGLLMLSEEGFGQVNSFISDCEEQAGEDEFIIHELLRHASKDLFTKKKSGLRSIFQKRTSVPYHRLVQKYSIFLTEVFEKNIGADLVGFLYDLFEDFRQDTEEFNFFLEGLTQIRNQRKEGEVLKKLGNLKRKGMNEVDVSILFSTTVVSSKEDINPSKESMGLTLFINQMIEMSEVKTLELKTPELELQEIEETIQKALR